MKVIVAGSRIITDRKLVFQLIDSTRFPIKEIVYGGATGVDSLGKDWALANEVFVTQFPAQWGLYGKAAGMIRNTEMAKYADALILIWDGKSSGSKHMKLTAAIHRLPTDEHIIGRIE